MRLISLLRLSRRGLLAGGLAAIALPLAACKDERAQNVTRNIRVIAQSEVAGKLVEGASVMSIRWRPGPQGAMYIDANTEAVALDLDGRGVVYVLDAFLSKNGLSNISYWPSYLLVSVGAKSAQGTVEELPLIRDASGRYAVKAETSRTRGLPLMVAFTDETKRETMFEVRPEDFGKVFGPDVRFLGIWMEFTDDPATETIPQRLPVMWHLNESYMQAYSLYDENGKLIPAVDTQFPQKFGHTAFFKRRF